MQKIIRAGAKQGVHGLWKLVFQDAQGRTYLDVSESALHIVIAYLPGIDRFRMDSNGLYIVKKRTSVSVFEAMKSQNGIVSSEDTDFPANRVRIPIRKIQN